MTVDQALQRGLLAKLKEAPLVEGTRMVRGRSASEGRSYFAEFHEETGAVEVSGPLPEAGQSSAVGTVRSVPDDMVWGSDG